MKSKMQLCECGCGQPVKWNKRTKKWNRFIKGHHNIQDIGFKKGHIPWDTGKKGGTKGSFKKGHIPWNKGKTKETDKRVEICGINESKTKKKLFEGGKIKHPKGMLGKENKWGHHKEKTKKYISEIRKEKFAIGEIKSWNTGKTKKNDERLKKVGEKISETKKRLFEEGKLNPPWEKGEKLPYPVWNKGKPWSEDILEKLSGPRPSIAGEKHPNWKGGISFEPYCHKFNDAFKEEIRDKFGRKCFLCPKTEEENGKKLCIHHVNYDKNCLCDDSECDFVPLCASCHSKTNFNREYWELTITTKLGAAAS